MRTKPFLRLFTLLLAVCLLAGLLPLQRAAAANSTISYRVEGDTLIYSGTGWVYPEDKAPEDVRNRVKHVIVEPGITRVAYSFMENSKSLETVSLPEGLDTILTWSFEYCENLRAVNIPSTVTSIGMEAFSGAKSLESIKLPAGLKSIGSGAFKGCASLKSVELPSGLEELEVSAFNGCTGLRRVTIPGSVAEARGFGSCSALEEAVISSGVRAIGSGAFASDTALKRVDIPDTVTSIGQNAFSNCTSLKEITLPASIVSIGRIAFSGCTGLKEITLPPYLTTIDKQAFSGCTGLTEITLPASLTSLDAEAFRGCVNLKKITFQGTQEQWDAFEPLLIEPEGGTWWKPVPAVYFTGEVECLGTGTVATTKVTFDAGSGTVSPAQKDVVYGETYGELPTPVNGNRIFYGWFTQPDGNDIVYNDTPVKSSENHTLYAHWSLETSALTPAKPGEAFTSPRDPFDKSLAVGNVFTVENGSNANREGGSYLFANEKGGLTMIQLTSEYADNKNMHNSLIITEVDSNFNITAQGRVPRELSYLLGFYPGKTYNFLLFCNSNPKGDEHEIVRVVKYDKNWNRLGSGSENVGTTVGFGNGTGADLLECAEYDDYLYIHAGRGMDIGHQACTTMVFRQSDMRETDTTASGFFDDEYVSHGYDQQIIVDREGRLVSMDLGDAGNHRAIALFQYKGTAHETLPSVKTYHVQEIAGTYDEDGLATGCTVAGLVEAGNYYLVVYQYDPTLSSTRGQNGDLLYQFVDKETLTGKSVKLADAKVDGVKITPVDDSSGYIIWSDAQDEEKIYYTTYGNGTVGTVRQAEGYRAGSTPILYQGKLVWYVDILECAAGRPGASAWLPSSGQYYKRFYTLDPKSGSVTHKDFMMIDTESASYKFTDVPANAYYADAVTWAVKNDITNGTSADKFSPNQNCTEIQILTFLWRAAGKPAANVTLPFSMNTGVADYVSAAKWAYSKGMIDKNFKQNTACTRASAVKFIWQAFGSPAASGSSFTDVPAKAGYAKAVTWAVANGVTNGTGTNTFSPNNTCTRGQIITFLHRAYVPDARLK